MSPRFRFASTVNEVAERHRTPVKPPPKPPKPMTGKQRAMAPAERSYARKEAKEAGYMTGKQEPLHVHALPRHNSPLFTPKPPKKLANPKLSARMAEAGTKLHAKMIGTAKTGYTGPLTAPPVKRAPVTIPHTESPAQATNRRMASGGGPSARQAKNALLRRSMDMTQKDLAGRVLQKGDLYKFASHDAQRDAKLPDKFLFDYLCSFVEEAYEHERREPEHKNVAHFLSSSLPDYFARTIMGELVQCLPKNPNLMRAAKKYNVNQDVIARLLVAKGILKPRSDSMWTDSDSASAMGASMLAESEPMAYSQQRSWMQREAYAEGTALTKAAPDDVAHLIVDDSVDPAGALQMRKSIELSDLWGDSQPTARVTYRDDCPVHGGRDLSKAQNLHNPHTPCICSGKANAYG